MLFNYYSVHNIMRICIFNFIKKNAAAFIFFYCFFFLKYHVHTIQFYACNIFKFLFFIILEKK